jgi:hypothetical protein
VKKVEAPAAKPAPAQQAFDVGKFAGIFAAIGLAVGAIGTAAASVVTGMLGLQVVADSAGDRRPDAADIRPLGDRRLVQAAGAATLGPILDANGWAVNARARINIPFGTSLTQMAKLPEGAAARAVRPLCRERRRPWKTYGFIALAIFIALAWWTR